MADLELNPDFSLVQTPTYSTLVTQFENGAEQRRSKWATTQRKWKLIYKNRPAADFTTIQTLFNTCLGAGTSFTWLNPIDNTEYTVRFADDSLSFSYDAYGIWNFEFSLIEVK